MSPDFGVSLLRVFFLQTLDKSRVPTEETTRQAARQLRTRCAPAWLKLLLAVRPQRSGGRPAPPGADGWRAATRGTSPPLAGPDGSAPREADQEEKPDPPAGSALRRARSARSSALAPRAPTRTLRALRRAHPARTDRALATRTTRAPGALSAHSRDARHASPLSHSLCDRHRVHG